MIIDNMLTNMSGVVASQDDDRSFEVNSIIGGCFNFCVIMLEH